MAQVLVRNLPDEVKESLRERAHRNRHSLEAEIRNILIEAAAPTPRDPVRDWMEMAERFREEYGGIDFPLPERDLPREVPPL